jgi:hypothetical protein
MTDAAPLTDTADNRAQLHECASMFDEAEITLQNHTTGAESVLRVGSMIEALLAAWDRVKELEVTMQLRAGEAQSALQEALNERELRDAAEKRLAEAEGVIDFLVDLKNYKEAHGKDDYYQLRQETAWAQARAFLTPDAEAK